MNKPVDHKQMFFKPGISATSINQYFESPLHFWRKSSYNPNKVKEPPTEAMIFGRLTHMLLLTPQDFNNDFCIEPCKEDLKGAVVVDTMDDMKALLKEAGQKVSGTKAELVQLIRDHCPQAVIWDDHYYMWRQTVGKREAISKKNYEKAKAMIDACLLHPSVKKLLGNGCSEEPITWYREQGGLLCKAKLDYNRSGLVIDYKTGYSVSNGHVDDQNPDPRDVDFAKSIASFGYHRQMAWCMDGIERVHGQRPRGAVLIAQDKEVPEAVSVSALTSRAIDIGMQENLWAYERIKDRLKSGQWPAYHPELRGVDLPRWYKSPALAA